MKTIFSRILLSASLSLSAIGVLGQQDDAAILRRKQDKILMFMDEVERIEPVSHRVQTSKNLSYLDDKRQKTKGDPETRFFDLDSIAKTKRDICYKSRGGLYSISAENITTINDGFKKVMLRKGVYKPKLLLQVNDDHQMAYLPGSRKGPNQKNPTLFLITTGVMDAANTKKIIDDFYHEEFHTHQTSQQYDKFPAKCEIQADSAQMMEIGYQNTIKDLRITYQTQKNDILKLGKLPGNIDYNKYDRQFTNDKNMPYPPFALRFLMLDLLNDKQKGDDRLYYKVKKANNL